MSVLHDGAPYRPDDRASLRVPVVMPLVEVAGFRQAFNLPMLGALDLGVDLRIVEVSFGMHAHHGDRLHAVIRASGFRSVTWINCHPRGRGWLMQAVRAGVSIARSRTGGMP